MVLSGVEGLSGAANVGDRIGRQRWARRQRGKVRNVEAGNDKRGESKCVKGGIGRHGE